MNDEPTKLFNMEQIAADIEAISKAIAEAGAKAAWNMKYLMGFNRHRKFSSSTNMSVATINITVRLPDSTTLTFVPSCGTKEYDAIAALIEDEVRRRLDYHNKELGRLTAKLPVNTPES